MVLVRLHMDVCVACRYELELDGVVKDVFDDASSAQRRGTAKGS